MASSRSAWRMRRRRSWLRGHRCDSAIQQFHRRCRNPGRKGARTNWQGQVRPVPPDDARCGRKNPKSKTENLVRVSENQRANIECGTITRLSANTHDDLESHGEHSHASVAIWVRPDRKFPGQVECIGYTGIRIGIGIGIGTSTRLQRPPRSQFK